MAYAARLFKGAVIRVRSPSGDNLFGWAAALEVTVVAAVRTDHRIPGRASGKDCRNGEKPEQGQAHGVASHMFGVGVSSIRFPRRCAKTRLGTSV